MAEKEGIFIVFHSKKQEDPEKFRVSVDLLVGQ